MPAPGLVTFGSGASDGGFLTPLPESVSYRATTRCIHSLSRPPNVKNRIQIVLVSEFDTHSERFVRGTPKPPLSPETARINKPRIESKQALLAENIPIRGDAGGGGERGPGGDRRSWGILEGEFSSQTTQPPGNDIKFESEVSQTH